MPLPKDLEEVFAKKEKFLNESEGKLSDDVLKIQKKLLDIILEDYVSKFDTDDTGKLRRTAKNMALLSSIDKVFEQLTKQTSTDLLKTFSSNLLRTIQLSAEYYKAQDIKASTVDAVAEKMDFIKQSIGIDENGKLIKGSYLDNLSKYESVKLKLQNYVVSSITTQKDLKSFTRGFKSLIEGKKRVDGAMAGYYRTYAHDKFFEIDAVVNNFYAQNLGLEYFIYEGSLIESSREFCIKRAGKVFSVEETKTWKDDPTLVDQKTKDSYNPLVERGRYNCRHFLKYISYQLAIRLRPDLKKAA